MTLGTELHTGTRSFPTGQSEFADVSNFSVVFCNLLHILNVELLRIHLTQAKQEMHTTEIVVDAG